MKSDENSIRAIAAQAHNAEADKRTLQKKLAASKRRVEELERRLTENQTSSEKTIRELSDRLSQEMNKVSEMMQQLVQYMMGNGDVSLAGTIHDKVVEGIREEVRKEMRAPRTASVMYENTSTTSLTVLWLQSRKIWPLFCPISGWNQSRFLWFTKESLSISLK